MQRRQTSSRTLTQQRQMSDKALKIQGMDNGPQIINEYFETIVEILKVLPADRSNNEIGILQKATSHFEIFQKYNQKKRYQEANVHFRCCRNFTYERYDKGSILFKQGDVGDKMYFVIKGRLNVYGEKDKADIIKEKEKLKEAQTEAANMESAQNAQIEHKVIVEETSEEYSDQKPREHGVVNVFKIMNVVRNLKRTLAKHEREKEKEKKKSSVLNFQEFPKLHQFIDEGVITVNQLSTIESGTVFGEIALSRKKPRSATVIATEETHLGVLTKRNFDEILYELENDRINKLVAFFQESLKMNITRDNVAKFAFIFDKAKFTMQSIVFKKGEFAEGFYLVKSGEVLLFNETKIPVHMTTEADTIQKKILEANRAANMIIEPSKSNAGLYQFPIQVLSEGNLLGEEVLAGLNHRICDAKVITSKATLLYVTKEKFFRFFSNMSEAHSRLIERAKERTHWKQQRIENSQEYTNILASFREYKHEPKRDVQRLSPKSIEGAYRKHNFIQSQDKSYTPELEKLRNIQTTEFKVRASSVIRSREPDQEIVRDSFSNLQRIVKCNEKILDHAVKLSGIKVSNLNPMTGDVFFDRGEKTTMISRQLKRADSRLIRARSVPNQRLPIKQIHSKNIEKEYATHPTKTEGLEHNSNLDNKKFMKTHGDVITEEAALAEEQLKTESSIEDRGGFFATVQPVRRSEIGTKGLRTSRPEKMEIKKIHISRGSVTDRASTQADTETPDLTDRPSYPKGGRYFSYTSIENDRETPIKLLDQSNTKRSSKVDLESSQPVIKHKSELVDRRSSINSELAKSNFDIEKPNIKLVVSEKPQNYIRKSSNKADNVTIMKLREQLNCSRKPNPQLWPEYLKKRDPHTLENYDLLLEKMNQANNGQLVYQNTFFKTFHTETDKKIIKTKHNLFRFKKKEKEIVIGMQTASFFLGRSTSQPSIKPESKYNTQ